MCVQFCFGSATLADREAPRRERHALERAQRLRPRPGTSSTASGSHPASTACTTRAVVAQRDHEVVEVVLEPALDDARRRR